jgi:hypothetical protein
MVPALISVSAPPPRKTPPLMDPVFSTRLLPPPSETAPTISPELITVSEVL